MYYLLCVCVSSMYKVVERGVTLTATESHQQALEEEVARLRLRNETLELRIQTQTQTGSVTD